MIKVHFIHGLNSSPQGNKARLLAAHFDATTPAMDTSDFEGCIDTHIQALRKAPPHVAVGSSFGGAVLCALIQRCAWTGPSLFLAQAAVRRGMPLQLPIKSPVYIVHGLRDEVVNIDDSRKLYAANAGSHVRLIEVDDDHSLHASATNGALITWIEELAAVSTHCP
ncbi:MAG: hypothetical protein GKR94_11695 [Gammaproteobacteria bacterium]|nr:hypothetical protein [Gammaproteobacteria bacterium]